MNAINLDLEALAAGFDLIGEPVFIAGGDGTILARNRAASLEYPPETAASVRDIVRLDAVFEGGRLETGGGETAVFHRVPAEGEGDGVFTLRIAGIGTDGGGCFAVEIGPERDELDGLREAARINDERVERLGGNLARVARELLSKTLQLAEEKNKVLAIVRNMGDGLAACGREGEIIQLNEAARELLGLDGNAIGRRLEEVCPELAEAAGFSCEAPAARDLNLQLNRRDLRVNQSPIHDDEGRCAGFVLVIHDRTRQAELDRMKSELISIVSHELRSPLASIKGYADLMLAGNLGEVPDSLREYIGVIANNARKLAALIDDMLDLSRIESGGLPMDFGAVDPVCLCRSVHAAMKPQALLKKLAFEVETGGGVPPVSGDAVQLQRALTNLVSNAIKYTPPEGRVTIRARSEDGRVWIEVEDNGIGVEGEDRERIFRKFYRVRNEHTKLIGGTGLGLCIARSLTEAHGGGLTHRPAPGGGSVFSIHLPAREG